MFVLIQLVHSINPSGVRASFVLRSRFRQQYTRPIPEGADHVNHKGKPAVRFKGPDGKVVLAPLTRNGDRCRVVSPTWYGRVPGAHKPVPLCANKAAAEMMLGELVRKAELARAGVSDLFEEHR
ncbi:MAG: hypothetical protein ACYC3I_25780 [Gemmataceae bacterium]